MEPDSPPDVATMHRRQAIDANNSVWELLDDETPDATELLSRAYAASYHWARAAGAGAGECEPGRRGCCLAVMWSSATVTSPCTTPTSAQRSWPRPTSGTSISAMRTRRERERWRCSVATTRRRSSWPPHVRWRLPTPRTERSSTPTSPRHPGSPSPEETVTNCAVLVNKSTCGACICSREAGQTAASAWSLAAR